MVTYIMTLSEVISDFNERIKKAAGLDAGYEKLRQQVRNGETIKYWPEMISLCSKEEGSMFRWVDYGESC